MTRRTFIGCVSVGLLAPVSSEPRPLLVEAGRCDDCHHGKWVRVDADGPHMLFCNNLDNKTELLAIGYVRECGSCARFKHAEGRWRTEW